MPKWKWVKSEKFKLKMNIKKDSKVTYTKDK